MTFILITINLAVFLFSYDYLQDVISNFGLSPSLIFLKPYTIITHMFVHSSIVHFLGNIITLGILGFVVEDNIGSIRFLLIYIFSGLTAVPFAFLLEAILGFSVVLVGASGAIFGIMFIAATLSGWEYVPLLKIPTFIVIISYLIFTVIMYSLNFPYSISEFAHFGGFLGGIIGFFLVVQEKKKA